MRESIEFHVIRPGDQEHSRLIALWYLTEWQIPMDTTIQRLEDIARDKMCFQVLMTVNGLPVATAGVYNHVALLDKEPRFSRYKYWLALVYTRKDRRQKGYGAKLCQYMEYCSINRGMEAIHLFTHTAQHFYSRLGWGELERIVLGQRKIVIMQKALPGRQKTLAKKNMQISDLNGKSVSI